MKRPSCPALFRIYLYGWARPGAVESEAVSGALGLHPAEEQLPAGVIIMGGAAPGSSTSSTLACQHKAPGHLALLTHCDRNVPFCTENHCGEQAPKPSGRCPQNRPACPIPARLEAGARMEPGAARGSAWARAAAPGAEMLSQGRLKPGRKSALKTDPKIKKLRFPSICFATSFTKAL